VKYLVDTHVFLWWMTDPEKLPSQVMSLIRNEGGEIAIKSAFGKVTGVPVGEIEEEVEAMGWSEPHFSMRHAAQVASLPFHPHDPFDRALIAQSIAEDLTFIT
jgi:PIN domain nuclease of toxin-antitoxin system